MALSTIIAPHYTYEVPGPLRARAPRNAPRRRELNFLLFFTRQLFAGLVLFRCGRGPDAGVEDRDQDAHESQRRHPARQAYAEGPIERVLAGTVQHEGRRHGYVRHWQLGAAFGHPDRL